MFYQIHEIIYIQSSLCPHLRRLSSKLRTLLAPKWGREIKMEWHLCKNLQFNWILCLFFLSTVGPLPLSDFSTSRYNLRICFIDRDIRNNKSTLCSELRLTVAPTHNIELIKKDLHQLTNWWVDKNVAQFSTLIKLVEKMNVIKKYFMYEIYSTHFWILVWNVLLFKTWGINES